VCLVGRRAPLQKISWRLIILCDVVGVVIVDFMIVPGDDPWKQPMRLTEKSIGSIECVTVAVLIEICALDRWDRSHSVAARFVDVIA
jgi:hypothetical protein